MPLGIPRPKQLLCRCLEKIQSRHTQVHLQWLSRKSEDIGLIPLDISERKTSCAEQPYSRQAHCAPAAAAVTRVEVRAGRHELTLKYWPEAGLEAVRRLLVRSPIAYKHPTIEAQCDLKRRLLRKRLLDATASGSGTLGTRFQDLEDAYQPHEGCK